MARWPVNMWKGAQSNWEKQIKTTMSFYSVPIYMIKIKSSDNTECFGECRAV